MGNVCRRKLGFGKEDVINLWEDLMQDCIVEVIDRSTFLEAIRLIRKYQFQLFDAIIVASAIQADCDVLYSEDMQNNLIIDNKLQIKNPFSEQ